MDQATQNMIDNLQKNTGKTLEQWKTIVSREKIEKHGEIMRFLKEEHALTHGFANLIALKYRGADAGSASSEDELITKQYLGKEHFKPLFLKS